MSSHNHLPAYIINSIAPIRICDNGGWTDTWFAEHGRIFNIGVYPYASVSPISVPNVTWWELERRLVLIYLGNAHNSSQVHEMVIHGLEDAGPDCPQLEALRQTAPQSRDALYSGDFQALGRAMIANTEAQRQLHPALVSREVERVIEIAHQHGAIGWKVNGAGGQGGSLTLLCGPRSDARRAMIAEIEAENRSFRNIPIHLSRFGLRVWKQIPA